jgi:glucosamine-6-phosphate deaminase
MNINVYNNAELAGEAAAALFAGQLLSNDKSVLGFATGSTPIATYQSLISQYKKGLIDFENIRSFNLDEYLGLTDDHEQSYRRFMIDNLYSYVNLPLENARYLKGTAADPEAECRAYDAEIEAAGGIDLQILGIGHNGHIAFNEPGEFFTYGTHVVNLTDRTIEANKRFFESADEVPKQALTMGIGTIMKARKIVLVATGEDKAQAVADSVRGPITPLCPASILQLHSDVIYILDAAAASGLR